MTRKITYTVEETYQILNISRATLFKLIKQNTIPSIKIGGRRLILKKDLTQYIQKQRNAA